MTNHLPPIYFYIPQADWPTGNMLESPNSYQEVYKNCRSTGTFNWILQTYLRLKEDGFPCELVGSLPKEGIIIAWTTTISQDLRPDSKQLLIIVFADKSRHPYAQLQIAQNKQEVLHPYRLIGDRYLHPGRKYYMPHWPQPSLIPRDPTRGDRFENVVYLGRKENLAPELKNSSWQEQLTSLGLRFQIVDSPEQWNDYSEVDAVLAVRSFGRDSYDWKPASKLYNAWCAGVPAILGCESAYQAERKNELDYIEAVSLNDVISALKQLKTDRELRQAIAENSRSRSADIQPERLVAQWRIFFKETAIPAYEHWCNSSEATRQMFLARSYFGLKTKGLRKDLQTLRNHLGLRTRIRSIRSRLQGIS